MPFMKTLADQMVDLFRHLFESHCVFPPLQGGPGGVSAILKVLSE